MESSITVDWAGGEWIRYLVRTTDRGMGQRGTYRRRGYTQPRTGVSPDTTTHGGRAYDMDGKGGTPAVSDWEVEEAINKLAPLRQIIRQGQNAM